MEKILVVNLNWLGDVLFTLPALKAIKKKSAAIYLAVALPSRCKRMLQYNPLIQELIEFDERSDQRTLGAKLKFIADIRREKFDKVIFFHPSSTRVIIFTLANIAQREGYCRRKTKLLLTRCIPQPAKDSLHKAEFFLNLVNALGYKYKESSYEFYVRKEEMDWAENFLKNSTLDPEKEKIICLHPGANWPPKRWPLSHFIKLIKLVSEWNKSVKFLIVGGEKDKILAQRIKQESQGLNKIIDLTGKTNLGTLGAIFLISNIVISGDSGPLHISCAVKPPPGIKKYKWHFSIGLYGPTDKRLTGPLSGEFSILEGKRRESCKIPCYDFKCKDYICMKSILPSEVFKIVKERLF